MLGYRRLRIYKLKKELKNEISKNIEVYILNTTRSLQATAYSSPVLCLKLIAVPLTSINLRHSTGEEYAVACKLRVVLRISN